MNIAQHTYSPAYNKNELHVPLWKKFIDWAGKQEENRFLWLVIGIVGHSCFMTIFTILAITFSGNHFIFWPFAIGATMISLITNVAALPTKITIPLLCVGVLIDLVIITLCIAHGFNISSTYR